MPQEPRWHFCRTLVGVCCSPPGRSNVRLPCLAARHELLDLVGISALAAGTAPITTNICYPSALGFILVIATVHDLLTFVAALCRGHNRSLEVRSRAEGKLTQPTWFLGDYALRRTQAEFEERVALTRLRSILVKSSWRPAATFRCFSELILF